MPESIEESRYINEMNTGQQRVFYPLPVHACCVIILLYLVYCINLDEAIKKYESNHRIPTFVFPLPTFQRVSFVITSIVCRSTLVGFLTSLETSETCMSCQHG